MSDRIWAAMEYVEQLEPVDSNVLRKMLLDAFLAGTVYRMNR